MKNLTEEKIKIIFTLCDSFIEEVKEKGINNGMILTINKADQVHYFHSFKGAYDYFLQMNWLY